MATRSRYTAEYVTGPAARASAVAETSVSSCSASAGLAGARAVSQTSASSLVASAALAAGQTVNETSVSTASVTGLRAASTTASFTSSSSASAGGGLVGGRTIAETSTSDMTATPVGPHATPVISLSAMTAAASQTGARTVTEVSLSDDTGSVFGAQAGFVSETSLSSGSASAAGAGFRIVTETSSSIDTFSVAGRKSSRLTEVSLSTDSLTYHRLVGASASFTSTSSLTVIVQVKQAGFATRIREKAPLQLFVSLVTPAGYAARWAVDDPNPRNVPGGLSFSTTMPGGDEQLGCTLARDPSLSYKDLEEFSLVTVYGAGRQVAAQHRLESSPDRSGDQMAISPGAVGWQAHLDDDNSAREIFVDRDITQWQGPSIQRQIQWLQNPGAAVVANGPSVGPDFSTQFPSLITELSGSWTENQVVEAWYDGHGIPIGRLYAAYETNGAFALTGGSAFGAAMFLPSDDTARSYDQINPIISSPGAQTLQATTSRPWALLQLWNDTVPGGKDGANFDLFWTALGVYGRHGLPLYGAADSQNAQGVLASDAVAYAINKWCPKLAYSTGTAGTIQPSAFVLPHLVFLDPSKVSDMIKEAVKYELLDWAVEPGPTGQPTFYLNARGARGQSWRARSGPAKLQGAGPNAGRIWNGVVVQWADVSGVTRTVGPPGAGCNYTDATLLDADPLNPVNQGGFQKYALVTMSTSTLAGATQIGRLFLQEQKTREVSGQATLTGHVQDSNGIYWPAWMVRAGDQISFTDAHDRSARRIVHTAYDDATKSNAIQLDQPPDSLQAILERLSVVLNPFGMS